MLYLKLFNTEVEKENHFITDDTISYVEETDDVYANSIYRVLSYTLNADNAEFVGLYSYSSKSNVAKVLIDGKPIDLSKLEPRYIEGTDYHFMAMFGEPLKTPDGHPIFNIVNQFNEEPVIIDNVWFDIESGIVRKVSDNEQAFLTIDEGHPTFIPGTYPIYYGKQQYQQDPDDPESIVEIIIPYVELTNISGTPSIEFIYDYFESLQPITGQFNVDVYANSLNPETASFNYCRAMIQGEHTNVTLTKNIKLISDNAFKTLYENNSIREIWFEGTIAEFNAIEKSSDWNNNYINRYSHWKNVQTVHCTDGDLSVA